jgi:hypothetical protein
METKHANQYLKRTNASGDLNEILLLRGQLMSLVYFNSMIQFATFI